MQFHPVFKFGTNPQLFQKREFLRCLTLNHLAVMRFETNLAVERRAPVRGLSGHVSALYVQPAVSAIAGGPPVVREAVNPATTTSAAGCLKTVDDEAQLRCGTYIKLDSLMQAYTVRFVQGAERCYNERVGDVLVVFTMLA